MKKLILLINLTLIISTFGGQILAGNAVRLPAAINQNTTNEEAGFVFQTAPAPLMCTSPAVAVFKYSDADNNMSPANVPGIPDADYASIGHLEYITLDLTGNTLPAGTTVTINWRKDAESSAPYAYLYESINGTTWNQIEVNVPVTNDVFAGYTVSLSEGMRYLTILNQLYFWLRVESVTTTYPCQCTNGSLTLNTSNNEQTVCEGSAITDITYSVEGGANGATADGLPEGVTGNYENGIFTISGTPTIPGTYNYTVTTSGSSPCDEATEGGILTIKISPVADEPEGDGSEGNPYQIVTLENLYWIAENSSTWDKYFIQTADIDASVTADWCKGGWVPIGIDYEDFVFKGYYDGMDHTISGIHITNPSSFGYGLFGIATDATIKNLGIVDVDISGMNGVAGGLVGDTYHVFIENCYTSGDISGGFINGGLVGSAFNSTMTDCYSSCNLMGASNSAGGLVGSCVNSSITGCHYVSGTVSIQNISGTNAGGLIGFADLTIISKSYSAGTVAGSDYNGGLIGIIYNGAVLNCYSRSPVTNTNSYNGSSGGLIGSVTDVATISNCYSTGLVEEGMGGLFGYIYASATIINSFWDTQTSGTTFIRSSSIDFPGGTGKTTAEMKTQSTFTGWDFETIWGMDASVNDGYPNLEGKTSVLTASVSIEASPAGSVCSGTSVTFTATPVNGGTPTYQWMKNGTAVEGETGSTFTTDALAHNDAIAVVMTSSLSNVTGSPATSNTIVTDIIPLPDVPGEISGMAAVCAGATGVTYSVEPVPGATSYNWNVPEGAEITSGSGTNSIIVTFGSTSGTVSVSAINPCGTTSQSTKTITVNPSFTPTVTIVSSDDNNIICTDTEVIFTATPHNTGDGTVAYGWFYNETYFDLNRDWWASTELRNGDKIKCEITVTGGTCLTTDKAVSNIIENEVYDQSDPSVVIESSVSGTFCPGTMVNFTAIPVSLGGTVAYQWKWNDRLVGSNQNMFTSTELKEGDRLSCDITVTDAACFDEKTASSNEITVSVYDSPEAGSINGTSELCPGITEVFSVTGNSIPGSWVSSNESVATVDQSGNVTAVSSGYATIVYLVSTTDPCMDSDVAEFDINVYQFIARITGFTEIGINGTTYLSPSTGGTWISSNPAVATVTDEGIVTGIAAGTATFTYTAASGCSATTGELTVKTVIDCITPVAAAPAAGDGSEENPYEIATLENLYWIKTNSSAWDKYFIQTADIDASSTAEWCNGGWSPIGYSDNYYFIIHYDGNYHVISGLHINSTSGTASGLFGAAENSEFKNLGITDVYIDAVNADHVGALLGWAVFDVQIDNCYSTGVVKGHNYCGGLAGYLDNYNSGTTIRNSYSTCNVSGDDFVGGLVGYCLYNVSVLNCYHMDGIVEGNKVSGGLIGYAFATMISKCYSTGNVTGNSGDGTGGLVGYMFTSAIYNSYSRCEITNSSTTQSCGGLVGFSSSQIDYQSFITNCYSTGPVQAGMGGLVGRLDTYGTTTITNSFWDTETSGTTTSAGGTGKPTILMKMESTFTDAGWDFENVWGIFHSCNDGYPYLRQESLRIPLVTITSDVSGEICSGIDPIFTATPYNTGGGNVSYSWILNGKSVGLDQNSYTLIELVPGYSYEVSCEITVTDPASCTSATVSSDKIIITVAPFPDAGVISVVGGGDDVIEVDEQVQLSSSLEGGVWWCFQTDIATIDEKGLVTGEGAGEATIYYIIEPGGPPCYYESDWSEFKITVTSDECTNPASGGEISGNQTICAGNDPTAFTSTTEASGYNGTLEYKWQYSDGNNPYDWIDIQESNNPGFGDSQTLHSTRWYRRLARVDCSADWTGAAESNILEVTVNEMPDAGTINGMYEICVGGTTLLKTTGNEGGTWASSNEEVVHSVAIGMIQALKTGTAIITYTVAGTGACEGESDVAEFEITVKPYPNAGQILGEQEICVGEIATLTSNGDANGTWVSDNENVASISQAGEVEGIAAGTAVITYTVFGTGGCEGEADFTTSTVTVSAIPDAPIAEAQSFCSADHPMVGNLKPSYDEGLTYIWYDLANGGSPLDWTTELATKTYYVSQKINGCESARTPVDVTVNITPSAPNAVAQSFCNGSDPRVAALQASGDEGATFNWYYFAEGGTPIYPKVNLTNGTYYVSQTVNGCEGPRTAVNVTVDEMPDAGVIEGSTSVCAMQTISLFSDGDIGGTWVSSDVTIATVDQTGIVSGIAQGSATISYIVTGTGGCSETNDEAAITIYVNTPPNAGTLKGQQELCAGAKSQLTTDGDLGGEWTSDNEDVAYVDQNGFVTTIAPGKAIISYSVEPSAGCKGDKATLIITVFTNSTAPTSVSSNPETSETGTHVCPGDLVTLSVSGGDLGTNPEAGWVWYEGGCGIGTSIGTGTTIEVGPTENTTYFVRAEGGCNTTECKSIDVWVWPQTQITSQPGDALISYGCLAKFEVAATGQDITYQWYRNDVQSHTGGEPITDATSAEYWPDCSVAGTFYYYVEVKGTCGTVISNVSTLTIDTQTAGASGILYYTGPKFAFTQNENSSSATIMLSATIKNNEVQVCSEFGGLAEAGDIRTALISFEIDKGYGWEKIPGATNLPVNYVDPNNISLGGTAAALTQIDIGSEQGASYELRVVVTGNYTGEPVKMECPVTIVRPQPGGIITGTVGLCNDNSAGFIKGMTGKDYQTVLNFEVKYSETTKVRGADQPKGKVWLLISSLNNPQGIPDGNEHTYLITSNAIADLAISCPKAHFTAKANVVELLENGMITSLEGNCTMVLDLVKDKVCDKVGITVYRAKAKGGIWYSNNWINGKTVPACICADDFEIGGCSIAETAVTEKTKSLIIEPVIEKSELKVYPNPFTEKLRFEFISPETVDARIGLYDMTGRLVKIIFEQSIEGDTRYEAEFRPDAIVSAVYFYRVTIGGAVYHGKVIFKKE